jgi:adenylate cyclase
VEQLSPNSDELPHKAVIRAALERVVASSHLNQSPQLASFLRFVVEETLAGRSDRIKAYSIAADALGRDSSFDADNDPIVRVSAGRLRRALRHYYADGGCDDPVVIELPFGNYVPVFGANSGPRRAKTRMQM